MTLKTLAAAACISLATATTAISAPITIDFSFEGVTGTFYGLDDADGTSSATSFDLSYVGLTWTGVPIADTTLGLRPNLFVFDAGVLVSADFRRTSIFVYDGTSGLLRLDQLEFTSEARIASFDSGFAEFGGSIPLGVDYYPSGALKFVINPVSAVPLPAGGLLLLSAFGGVAALKRRKKRAA